MSASETFENQRYCRSELFEPMGSAGQQKLLASKVLIVGAGGLGSWLSELLVRSGVGTIRLVDSDVVDWTNLARQAMYDESDAKNSTKKIDAARKRLTAINSTTNIEAIAERVTPKNIAELASDVDLILDSTDDWTSRFVINDFAVKTSQRWIHAGVVCGEGQVMTCLPGRGACLRCIFETPPPPETEAACKASVQGVLGPAVSAIAAIEAMEAIKILTDNIGENLFLTKFEMWSGRYRQIDVSTPNPACPCCSQRKFDFLQQ